MTYQPKTYRRNGGNQAVVDRSAGGVRVDKMSAATITDVGAATYTAAQMSGGLILRDPNGAGRTDVTPTAAQLIAGFGLENDDEVASCYLVNTADAAEAITLSGGTGVTIANAGQTIAQSESAVLLIRRTGAAAVSVYIFGA